MATKACCRSCQHCCEGQTTSHGWCRLRQITVHSEIIVHVFCHHWMKKSPSLPRIQEQRQESSMDRQLEFDRPLVGTDL